jgi:site-specific DNA-methyltransferase (adenine-specific)
VNFSTLRQEAGLELLDAVTEFSAPMSRVSRWETGAELPPPSVINSLIGIGRVADLPQESKLNNPPADAISNTLFEGDCLEILKQIPTASANLILCDLPYGTTQNRWDSVIDLERLWYQYKRILAPKGAVVLTSQGIFTAKLILSNEDWFKYKIVWEKSKSTNFLNAKKQPLRKHEDICIFYDRPATYNPQMTQGLPYDKGVRKDQLSGSYGDFLPVHVKSDGERYPSDVVYFKTAESEPGRSVWHPTQKPIELGRYLVRTFSNEGDVVLDNAFGSGSFLVAAAMEKRKFIGIELNKEVHRFKNERIDYVELATDRLSRIGVNPTVIRA